MSRWFIALPAAGVALVAVYLAMNGLLFPAPNVPDWIGECVCSSREEACICLRPEQEATPSLERPSARDAEAHRRLPPPPRVEPESGEPQAIPRERFPAPEPDTSKPVLGTGVREHCEARLRPVWPPKFPEEAGDVEQVTVEYTVAADGSLTDIKVIASSNPQINDDIVRMMKHWRYSPRPDCEKPDGVKIEPKTMQTRLELRREKGKEAASTSRD